jgi:hypothetical protein
MADEKEGAVVEEVKETKPAAGAQADPDKVPFSEHPRWKEVYGNLKEYKQYGSPREIEAKLNRAAELETAFAQAAREAAEAEAAAAKTPEDEKQEKIERQAQAQLRKLLPELEELENLKAANAARWNRLEQAAVGETRTLLKELGETDTKEEVLKMSDILADVIKNDPDLYAEYEINPRKAVRGAFDAFAARFKSAGERTAAAKRQNDRESAAKLPKAHGGGGEGGGGEVKPPTNLNEATKRAIERLKGMEF